MSENRVPLGKLIHSEQTRDAIHIAVAPVTAGCRLSPGDHVGMMDGEAHRHVEPIGVVDPFLAVTVARGERFWLLLYPYTITSLRHEWVHPAFGAEPVPMAHEVAGSERWLRSFAAEWGMDYDGMIVDVVNGCPITAIDRSIHSWDEISDGGTAFWRHIEIVTGHKFDAHHREEVYFSCSC